MKLSKQAKLIVLVLTLVILITGGIGLIVSFLDNNNVKAKLELQSNADMETTAQQPVAEQIPEGMEIQYVKNDLTTLLHIGRFSGEFVNYKGKSVLYYDQKLLDLQTGETILELPDSVFANYVWGYI